MNDTLTKNKIKYYLDKNPLFNFSEIKIFVSEGSVILAGTVLTNEEKVFAESAISQMREVNEVKSKIELRSEAITLRLPPIKAVFQNISRA